MADFTKEEIEAELIARKQAETPFFGNPNITAEAEAVRNRVGGYKDPGEGIVPYLPTIGGVAGGLLTRRKEGAGLGATIGRSLAGSSAGTLAGTGAQELSYERTGTERDPFAQRAGENLVENAIFDVGGNLVFASLGKLYRVGKEALQDVPALQGLFKAGESIADFDAKKLAQEMLQKYGATLDKFQVTEGGAARTARGIAQSSFTARPLLEKSEKAVREAGLITFEEAERRRKSHAPKKAELSKESLDILRYAGSIADKKGNVKLSERAVDTMIDIGAIKDRDKYMHMLPKHYQEKGGFGEKE
jgi:hypothetical protein